MCFYVLNFFHVLSETTTTTALALATTIYCKDLAHELAHFTV